MKSHVSPRFIECLAGLPASIPDQARRAYRLFQENPHHPSLRYKQVHPTEPVMSVRVGLGYRALGVRRGEEIVWFWIGSHADYDRLVS